jgi:hypothetical protein
MPATEPGRRTHGSRFVPTCAAARSLACWLLALAGCLNPVPDTDPSVRPVGVNDGATIDVPAGGTETGSGQNDGFSDLEQEPGDPSSPAASPPVTDGSNSADAGAPPADAGTDAGSEDEQ